VRLEIALRGGDIKRNAAAQRLGIRKALLIADAREKRNGDFPPVQIGTRGEQM